MQVAYTGEEAPGAPGGWSFVGVGAEGVSDGGLVSVAGFRSQSYPFAPSDQALYYAFVPEPEGTALGSIALASLLALASAHSRRRR